ncbi:unnamed protein product [Caenorhabditis angaria]|uniref:Deacetylase sirtuin-type domain-containing protein n=1 Tax=Caenorhabditis angaria TaxID=860376 RepID=A0A9P1IPT1_9PELO|nr:unnamed protein product [Caenorhabditis angaria]
MADEKNTEELDRIENPTSDDVSDTSSQADSDSWQNSNGKRGIIMQVESMLSEGKTAKEIFSIIFPDCHINVNALSDSMVFGIMSELLDRPPVREKLPEFNTLQDAVELFRTKKRILVLTGAGVSVSCGIPDFRSKDGIYARLHAEFPDLPDPTAMFDILSHRFIKLLEDNEQLLRNYTQNIDTLEHQTGISRVIECHGSFSKATCTKCGEKFDGDVIREDVMNKRVAYCRVCNDGVIKPDIVFFGEDLGKRFHRKMAKDKNHVDLLVVIGSSLKVRPVSLIPFSVDENVPQILINRESLPSYRADIELLGNCDDIIREICFSLGGNFSEMIEKYDEEVEKKKKEEHRANRKRRFIELSEFEKIMCEKGGDDDGSKKLKLEEDQAENQGESSTSTSLGNMYQMRYVNIEKNLPPMSCAQVSINQTVFPGAEINYDLDAKMVCRAPIRHVNGRIAYSDSDSSSGEDEGEEEEMEKLARTTSVDNLLLASNADTEMKEEDEEVAESCPADLEYEESNRVSLADFRQACNDLSENFD